MFDTVRFFLEADPLFLAFTALVLDVPRYTLSLISHLALAGAARAFRRAPAPARAVLGQRDRADLQRR